MEHLIKVFDGDPLAALLVFFFFIGALIIGFVIAYVTVCAPPLPWSIRRKPAPKEQIPVSFYGEGFSEDVK